MRRIKPNWTQLLCIKILKNGPMPKHIGFITDGNRRWATANDCSKLIGHTRGYNSIMEVFQWCIPLGISIVTVFVVSVCNLKRDKDEVDNFWHLMQTGLETLLEEKELLKKWGMQVRVIGELSKIPKNLHKLVADVVIATEQNDRMIINLAIPYSSGHEITHAVKEIVKGIGKAEIFPEDITEDLISECLYTSDLPEPDMIVRTSGEIRLSDFLLWQTTSTCFYFTKVYWPAFSAWDLMAALTYYQRCYKDIVDMRSTRQSLVSNYDNSCRVPKFVNELRRSREGEIKRMSLEITAEM